LIQGIDKEVQLASTATSQPNAPQSGIDGAVSSAMLRASQRLQKEIPALGNRSNLNLAFGVFFALGGMFALWWAATNVATSFDPAKDWKPVLLAAIPRVSLAIIVELFAYFFLGLYRSSLAEIKYFHNEITTAELKLLALRVALASKDSDAVRSVVIECARSERNFRLAKDESTVELEKEKLDGAFAYKVLDKVGDLLKKYNGPLNPQRILVPAFELREQLRALLS
jgi:hypothetical protein